MNREKSESGDPKNEQDKAKAGDENVLPEIDKRFANCWEHHECFRKIKEKKRDRLSYRPYKEGDYMYKKFYEKERKQEEKLEKANLIKKELEKEKWNCSYFKGMKRPDHGKKSSSQSKHCVSGDLTVKSAKNSRSMDHRLLKPENFSSGRGSKRDIYSYVGDTKQAAKVDYQKQGAVPKAPTKVLPIYERPTEEDLREFDEFFERRQPGCVAIFRHYKPSFEEEQKEAAKKKACMLDYGDYSPASYGIRPDQRAAQMGAIRIVNEVTSVNSPGRVPSLSDWNTRDTVSWEINKMVENLHIEKPNEKKKYQDYYKKRHDYNDK